MEDQELKPRKSNAGRHKKDCTCENAKPSAEAKRMNPK